MSADEWPPLRESIPEAAEKVMDEFHKARGNPETMKGIGVVVEGVSLAGRILGDLLKGKF